MYKSIIFNKKNNNYLLNLLERKRYNIYIFKNTKEIIFFLKYVIIKKMRVVR